MTESLREQLIQMLFSIKKGIHTGAEDMPHSEFHVLRILMHFENADEATVSDICRMTRHSMPAISQTLRSLEKKGFITRGMSPSDRRRVTVSLTPSGISEMSKSKQKLDERMNEVLSRFGEDKTRKLIGLLTEFIEVLQSTPTGHDNR